MAMLYLSEGDTINNIIQGSHKQYFEKKKEKRESNNAGSVLL